MVKKRTSAKPTAAEATTHEPLVELSEEEQWRLINQSGILKQVPKPASTDAAGAKLAVDEPETAGDEIFNALLLIIPFSFILLLMEILTHRQFKQEPTLKQLVDRMLPGVPILSLAIFYGKRYRNLRQFQALVFFSSIACGIRLIWIINRANWKVNMKQCPPLATAWILTIVALELGPAVMSLAIIGVWAWWTQMKLAW